ncbi:carcinoembryonic antigen-related cell adhesion molecule 1-like [Pimephales promelas]|uniref:carcinoembryonic antigen-related cell adhesion molecule 1-like n=1 Tax=Pimephales promelas TaxID=90988 RepID=UPI001955AB65|nr:carcinoembryonic antigen-related cell adhesion molecule 1-like [Pimephales promelas]
MEMKPIALTLLVLYGVSGVDTEAVSVMEGDSVTLNTGVQTNQQQDIKWYFKDTRIAQINGNLNKSCTDVQCKDGDERFRDRLKLDNQTGSLTITNTRTSDSGEYKLYISSNNIEKIFSVAVHGVSAVERDAVKRKKVKEGQSVTLDPDVVRQANDFMTWSFNGSRLAEITGDQSKICTDDQCKERFRDRLKLNHQTGSLTITNTRNTDSGEYKLQINSINSSDFSIRRRRGITIEKSFRVSVIVEPGPGSGLTGGAIAGIVVAVVVVVLAVIAGARIKEERCRNTSSP